MSVYSFFKKKQNRYLSKTWRSTLVSREIEKNNYHVTGNVKKAREFATMLSQYQAKAITNEPITEPIIIYSAV